MSFIQANGARLFVQDVGHGEPIVFVHEMAADYREWEDQVRWFSRKYRCVTFSARGYKPSEVPASAELYGLEYAADDIAAVIDGLNLGRAHVIGLSMGAYAALRFGMKYPEKARSLVIAGVGSGSLDTDREAFVAKCRRQAEVFRTQGSAVAAQEIGVSPTRLGFKKKDPLAWQRFVDHLGEHDPLGMAHTLTMYQASRPAIQSFEAEIKQLNVPVFLVVGDIDDPCLETNLYLKRTLPDARLLVYPNTGHMINIEEPAAFNNIVQQFLDRAPQ